MADGAQSASRLCDVGCIMYPMVQQQQQQTTQQQRQQQDEADVEQQESSSSLRHRPHRPLYRRFFSYVREAWTGVKFALGKPKHTSDNYRLSPCPVNNAGSLRRISAGFILYSFRRTPLYRDENTLLKLLGYYIFYLCYTTTNEKHVLR